MPRQSFVGQCIAATLLIAVAATIAPAQTIDAAILGSVRDSAGAGLSGVAVTAAGNTFIEAYPGPGTTGPKTHPNLWQYAGFVQDDWRVMRNLTLNLGVRYDVELAAQPAVRNPTAFAQGLDTLTIPNDTNNIAPRVGFAWQPVTDKAFVVRGGYGLFYGNTPSIMYGTADSNNGINVQTLTFAASVATPLPASYPNVTCGPPQQNAGCPVPTGATLPAPTIFVSTRTISSLMSSSTTWEWNMSW